MVIKKVNKGSKELRWPRLAVCPMVLDFRTFRVLPDDELLDPKAQFDTSDILLNASYGR